MKSWTASVSYGKFFDKMPENFDVGPYYKSKLELKSNSSEILSVICKFIYYATPT